MYKQERHGSASMITVSQKPLLKRRSRSLRTGVHRSVLSYQCKDFPEDSLTPLLTAPSRLPPPPFYSSSSLGAPDVPQTFRMLSTDALPGRGDLVSIDCEFIALNCEQVGIRTCTICRLILLLMVIVLYVRKQTCDWVV